MGTSILCPQPDHRLFVRAGPCLIQPCTISLNLVAIIRKERCEGRKRERGGGRKEERKEGRKGGGKEEGSTG